MEINTFHKKKILFLLVLINFSCAPFTVVSQTDSLKDKTELFDIYFSGGSVRSPVFSISQADFKKIVPGSKILSGEIMKVNFNDFNNDSAGGFFVGSAKNTLYAQAGITLKLKNKEFRNAGPWLKLGMNYFSSSTILNTGVFKSNSLTNDSSYYVSNLPVSSTTTNVKSVTYEYSCQSINLESTLIYKLNPAGIFSLFGGPGVLLGLNFDGKAKLVETDERRTFDNLFASGSAPVLYKYNTQRTEIKEEFNLHPNLCFGLFINIGLDLRLGNSYDYIKNTHLFMEVKPMFRSYAVKGAGFQSTVLLVGNLGLRYELD